MSEITLKPGTIGDYSGSMAEAMENAFKIIWPEIMGTTEGPKINNHLRMMFIAIAQGVVQHLVTHADAIKMTMDNQGDHAHSINYTDYTDDPDYPIYIRHNHTEATVGSHTHNKVTTTIEHTDLII